MATTTTAPASGGELKPTLGLTGVTINAMALIAPGAFLWTTFQGQSAWGATSMWASVAVATLVALLTASCYALLSKQYPQAGAGSSYFYAEAAFLEKEEYAHFRLARVAKLLIGCAAHLYYWVYPGVMVAFMGTILVFIGQLFNPNFAAALWHGLAWEQMGLCAIFAVITGAIAYRGVTGSTMANVVINVVQIIALLTFTILAIVYRGSHPNIQYVHPSALSVVSPHGFTQLLFQSTIAILLVVGFESATALAAESKNPLKDIPRGVILSLIIQAVIFYSFEYFGANYFIGQHYAGVVDKSGANFTLIDPSKIHDISQMGATYTGGKLVYGFDAAAADSAPIGSFSNIIGNALLHGHGLQFELIMAVSVVLALVGTALSCLATGVRVSYAMGKDDELPGPFGSLHGKYNTPHNAIIMLTVISAIIGSYGVLNADNLIKIAVISNLGTFLLYGMTCLATFVAFSHVKNASVLTTKLIPILGMILNFGLMLGDIYFAFFAPSATDASKYDAKFALVVSATFMLLSFAYLAVRSVARGEPMFLPPDHKKALATH
ncbi:MAG: APC family permease [Armatimonadetes bacterium]|nr:APC family permease [Armatimonadota bacterium]